MAASQKLTLINSQPQLRIPVRPVFSGIRISPCNFKLGKLREVIIVFLCFDKLQVRFSHGVEISALKEEPNVEESLHGQYIKKRSLMIAIRRSFLHNFVVRSKLHIRPYRM